MTAGCGSADVESVNSALRNWMVAVNNYDLQAIEAMYMKDAVLLPTLSNRIRTDADGRRDYFRKFTALPGLKGKITKTHMRLFSDIASAEGFYTFTYRRQGRTVRLPARFSFTWLNKNGEWKIASHHSSPLPE